MPIPPELNDLLNRDPEYEECMLRGVRGHVCGGNVTREHAITFKGSALQKKWAIVAICARAHEVHEYQDAGTMDKQLNVWLALNRATDAELREISKAKDYVRERQRLNRIYGEYVKPEPKFKTI